MTNQITKYLESGFALVGMRRGEKGPVTIGWNKQVNTVTDPKQAGTLTGNVGLAHAYCRPITMSLDVDDALLATSWLQERGISLEDLLNAIGAVQIVSGKPNRAKLLHRLPDGCPPVESIKIFGGTPRRVILEFRCADAKGLTVQDVLPPSIHPETGQPYRWGGKGHWSNLPEIPDKLLSIWRDELSARTTKKPPKRQSLFMASFKAVDDTPRQRAVLAQATSHITAACDYDRYRDIVWAHLSLGWSDAESLAKKWCETAPDRFDEAGFNQVVASYDVSRSPTIRTIMHYARLGGWHE